MPQTIPSDITPYESRYLYELQRPRLGLTPATPEVISDMRAFAKYAGMAEAIADSLSEGSKGVRIASGILISSKHLGIEPQNQTSFDKDIFEYSPFKRRDIIVSEYAAQARVENNATMKVAGMLTTNAKNYIRSNGHSVNLEEILDIRHEDTRKSSDDNSIYSVSFDDIVGNRSVIDALTSSIDCVLLYNPSDRNNPVNSIISGFQSRFLIWGRPGQGKTATISACLAYAQDMAKKYRRKLAIHQITNSFKNSYYSASADNLRRVFDDIREGERSHILIADDIDMIFQSRNEASHGEDETVLHELITYLEGFGSGNIDNSLFIATTNYPERLDPALARRLNEFSIEVKGPETREDYENLFKIKLRKELRSGLVDIVCWDSIGEICKERIFTGSNVSDIAKRISALTNRGGILEALSVPENQRAAYLKSRFRKVSEEEVLKVLRGYEVQDA